MIHLDHISKKFGKFKALNNINLTFEKGECLALIGPNGCGKTTLIKSILGMVIPSEGNIQFDGKDIKNDWSYREKIGYMPQIGRYPENMTIGQVLNMMKDIRKVPENKLDLEVAELFEIDGLLDKKMSTLSGGTRQKVSACLAFMFDPKVLILDEPTAGLDPVSVELLKEKILREKAKNKLIIITSHVLSELDDLVTQVVYMFEGRVAFHKSLQQLKMDTGEGKLSKAIAHIMMNQQKQMHYQE
ncbi:MAG TPA: ABC transporter ATP-binding protein [Sphingobacteriaceae bacterium]|nr:ABC transporter ATP-binding protein [Sphingobacteriaceae bacterium]